MDKLKKIIPDSGTNTDYDTGLSSSEKINDNATIVETAILTLEEKTDQIVAPILTPLADVATVAALKTTYPTAVYGNAAKVLADGLIYSFNGVNWLGTGEKAFPSEVLVKGDLSVVFQPKSSSFEDWANRILALKLDAAYNPNLYYSPAITDKRDNSISISIFSNTSPYGNATWNLVQTFEYQGDTTIDSVVRSESGTNIIFINPSKFLMGYTGGVSWSIAGLLSSVFQDNEKFLSLENYHQLYNNIGANSILLDSGNWVDGGYVDIGGSNGQNESYMRSELLKIDGRFIKKIRLSKNIVFGSTQNNVSFFDDINKLISGFQSPAIIANNFILDVPPTTRAMKLSNHKLGGKIEIYILHENAISSLIEYTKTLSYPIGTGIVGWIGAGGNALGTIFKHSEYIPVTPLFTYLFSGRVIGASIPVNIYSFYSKKEEESFISGLDCSSPTGALFELVNEKLVPPAGAKYMRLASDDSNFSLFKINGTFDDYHHLISRELSNEPLTKNFFALPKFIDCIKGRRNDLFLDCMSTEPNFDNGSILTYGIDNLAEIKRRGKLISYQPASASQNTTVSLIRVDSELKPLYSKDVIFRPISKAVGNGTVEKNVCFCGDSLVNSGVAVKEVFDLLREDGDFVFNEIGTRENAGVKHEGRNSWTWAHYIDPDLENMPYQNSTNSFMINGKLDFKSYMNNNFPTLPRYEIDYFIIALGTNDVSQGEWIPPKATLSSIIEEVKIFINALLDETTGFPDCKIAIGLPGVGAPVFPNISTRAETFRKAIQSLNQLYIDTFDNGKYHANVTCVSHGIYIDRYNSYPHVDEPISDYITDTVRQWTNSVHPDSIGYKQWGRGYYGKIRGFLAGNL